jgi:tRNA G10  N-methylase Trm11
MKYFFALGNNPTLSTAELSAIFPKNLLLLPNNVIVLETDREINCQKLIKKLGGTIKIGKIKTETDDNKNKISQQIKTLLNPSASKYKFGISYYGKGKFNIKSLGMEIKKYLRNKNISCRWVVSRETVLSSVVVEQNKLTSGGIEIALIKNKNKILIGQTLAVQPFKELSFRDYGRPARDDYSGMLPPKLAQIMINLSQTKTLSVILDPFCGSGTILTEAMLMGCRNIIGADISKKAIKDTKKNVEWIKNNFQLSTLNFKLFNKSVLELSQFIKPKSVDAIITEPYLGPQRGKIDVKKIKNELGELYSKSFIEFKKILKPRGRIVMVWPVFISVKGTATDKSTFKYISPRLDGLKIINPIPEYLRKNKFIKLTERNTIIYGRLGQKVWREIVVLSL